MLRTRYCHLLAGLIVLLAACSRSTPTAMDMEMSEAIITQFYTELGTARCERFVNCCDSQQQEQLVSNMPSLATMESCESAFAATYAKPMEQAISAARLMTIQIDTAAMETCLESTRMCGPVDACKQVFAGTLDDKETCQFNVECIRGSCITTPQIKGQWCSSGEEGSHCWLSSDCFAEGYYCGPDGRCIQQKEANARCATDDECLSENCSRLPDEKELYCFPGSPRQPLSIDMCDGVEAQM